MRIRADQTIVGDTLVGYPTSPGQRRKVTAVRVLTENAAITATHGDGGSVQWMIPRAHFVEIERTIRHGGNPDLVLEVVRIGEPTYGSDMGLVVMAKGNGGWYVGVADKPDPVLLWSPNFYGYECEAESYFEQETKHVQG